MFVYEGKIRKKNPIKFYGIKANPKKHCSLVSLKNDLFKTCDLYN